MTPYQCKKLVEAMSALYAPPMTDADRAERRRLIAREMARAESRRAPSPQMELDAP